MANFHTHITVSSLSGVAYGAAGHFGMEMPVATSIIAGSLCAVSGMLPDLDSDNSVPVREMLCFGAAAIPMLLVERFRDLAMSHEEMIVIGVGIYALIRFGFGSLLNRFTVHRGMFHSIPAMFIAFVTAYLLCQNGNTDMRFFKAGGVAIGFLSHLVLDEIWAVRWTMLGPRTKKSFGTAIKFFGDNGFANSITYAILLLVGMLAYQDISQPQSKIAERPTDTLLDRLSSTVGDLPRR